MNFFQSAVLGLVQGLTEFIPVSSTGHLILARRLLGLDLVGTISFDAVLQLATALAVSCYFWKDILNLIQTFFRMIFRKEVEQKSKNTIFALIIGTIPAIIFGLLLESYMDTNFRSVYVVAGSLVAGSILFFFAERWHNRPTTSASEGHSSLVKEEKATNFISARKSLVVGLFQCLALVPGFSRSGATISGGLFAGLSREEAARFSFLLSIPIILGSGLKKFFDIYQAGELASLEHSLFIACLFAFISGLLAIHFLIKFLKNHSLNWFGGYRILLAIVILIFL